MIPVQGVEDRTVAVLGLGRSGKATAAALAAGGGGGGWWVEPHYCIAWGATEPAPPDRVSLPHRLGRGARRGVG